MSNSDKTGANYELEEEQTLFKGHLVTVSQATLKAPDGEVLQREIVRHPGAVVVVALDDRDRVSLIRQYRAAVGGELVELVAGKRDQAGEDPVATAARELAEEAGLVAESYRLLATFYNSPGFCDEFSYLYLANGLSEVPRKPQGSEERHCELLSVPLEEALQGIDSGWIKDAKTILGLSLAALSRAG